MPTRLNSICDVPGIKVGCAQNDQAKTGCTVVLPQRSAMSGVDIRGSAPGTREIEAIKPVRLISNVDAILLTGGSAFGLDAAGGVQQFLEERGRGVDVGVTKVPIVPAAVIFDLNEGDAKVRPDKTMGYRAAAAAKSVSPRSGRFGAGCGATVGKALGHPNSMKGGQGSACIKFGDVHVGALAVVNAFGNVFDPAQNRFIAGAKDPSSGKLVDAEEAVWSMQISTFNFHTNTTLAVVATDAALSKQEITKVAQMAQDGFARTIFPAHTIFDGDLIFALSVGNKKANSLSVGTAAAQMVAAAVIEAVTAGNK